MLPFASCAARIRIATSSSNLGVNYGKPERVEINCRWTHVANKDMHKVVVARSTVRLDHSYGQSALYLLNNYWIALWMRRGKQTRPRESGRSPRKRPAVLRPRR